MHTATIYLNLAGFFLLFVSACGQQASPEPAADELKDAVSIINQDNLKKLSPNSEIVVRIEMTHHTKSQPTTTTAIFQKDKVSFGESIGSAPEPSSKNPGIFTSDIKITTPKSKGKYEFIATCRYEGEKAYVVNSDNLTIQIE